MENPYAPPSSALTGQTFYPFQSVGGVPAGAVEALRQTRPWVLVLAILGTLACGMMVLAAIGTGLAFVGGQGADGNAGMLSGLLAVYAAVGFCYLWPVIRMYQFAAAISRLVRRGEVSDLERALRCQKSVWKFVALLPMLFIAAYVLLVGVAAVGAAVR